MGRHFPGLLFLATFCLTNQVSATTIPAGTGLSVRTTEPLSSDNPPRTKFGAQLERDVIVRGKRVLPAGTRLRGQIVSARSFDFTPVVLNVTSLASKGRLIPIKTVEGFRMD